MAWYAMPAEKVGPAPFRSDNSDPYSVAKQGAVFHNLLLLNNVRSSKDVQMHEEANSETHNEFAE